MGGAAISGKVKIGDFSNIGTNATILPNISIGENCFIGAGAVVTKDVLNNQVVYGVPARLMKMQTLSANLEIFDNL
jgi:acetyltransferase-like isoleucine patch superfamily enzyme